MMETAPSGTVLHGRYRIERVLGSGGFGHVYLAFDLRTNQQYALKEYFVTGSNGQAQLQHEARVLSQLHHPSLPAFLEAFNERGHYFVVLSYIEGSDLTDLIRVARQRNDAIPLSRVMGWILSVCDAVHFLHSQRPVVIHRDIKPDNIRIMPNGTAILVDLGNAKATADGSRTLFFIRHQGTPGYAPQEQYPGGTGTDVRSDIYALGGTLYFALTAHEPPSVSTRNQSIQQGQPDLPSLQEQLANNPPDNTSDANARQFRLGVAKPSKPAPRHIRHLAQLGTLPPELLDQLNRIIKRAMAMKQKDRYPSVAEFSKDLRKVMAALPLQPEATSPSSPSSRPIDPNSTQPDLPMLYDAIQTAKASIDQPAQATSKPAMATACPRCGATLVPSATFCPGCGSSIASLFKTNPVEPGNVNISAPQAQNRPPVHDVNRDQAQSHKPQMQAQAQTYTSTAPKPRSSPVTLSTPVKNTIASSSGAQVQSTSTPGNTPQASPTTSTSAGNPSAKAGGFSVLPVIIALTILLLAVLMAVFLIFLVIHGHASRPFHYLVSVSSLFSQNTSHYL